MESDLDIGRFDFGESYPHCYEFFRDFDEQTLNPTNTKILPDFKGPVWQTAFDAEQRALVDTPNESKHPSN